MARLASGRYLLARCFAVALALPLCHSALAQSGHRHFNLESGKQVAELRCPQKSNALPRRSAPAEALEPPDAEELDQISVLLGSVTANPAQLDPLAPIPRRIAIWGDSHLAAGSFAAELRRVLGSQGVRPQVSMLPLTMGRAGVILPVRRVCMDGWKSELAYSSRASRIATGIGMNALQGEAAAYLWLDLRNAAGEAEVESIELFFNAGTDAGSAIISIDGGPEARVVLEADDAFGRVGISSSDGPISVLKLRAQSALTLHAIKLKYREPPVAVLDAFGIPGGTMRAWQQIDPVFFGRYVDAQSYDMVMLQFGTNEGNARPFDETAYTQMLEAALHNMRQVFPVARCVLLAPGDRGVLLPKSRKKPGKHSSGESRDDGLSASLLRFSAIHEKIFQIQQRIGARHGCAAWSMQQAMGGQGAAYRWLLANPPLMARDLIHFTPAGYQRLAQALAEALGWTSGLPANTGVGSAEPR
ncbi:MAG: GDSL-type esterase/lipase family protein [Burkholderiaceae bacterium]